MLQPLTGEKLNYKTSNTSPEARLDVSVRGFWTRGQRTFCDRDVRVFDPSAPRLLSRTLESAYIEHEQEKRRGYNQRVLQVEQGSFTPLIFSILVEWDQSVNFSTLSRLSQLLIEKRHENFSVTTSWLRCKLSFSLLRSALLCIRGSRTTSPQTETYQTTIDFTVNEARIE